ncbi:MAG: GNAT family N-acetyltransferase [Candidatus Aminicenantes bacterium]|nr:GNAT family N-acetyltransferase [Candidatus Aminicenantes bacterium]MBL7082129.1 GNAT family N-acetyltransferase [Candidatus Aminicenantes bacterium]
MEKKETLKDGTKILIRGLHVNDLDKLMKFYSTLPPEDQKYLRIDVTDKKVVEQRIELTKAGNVFRLIALFKDEIIADGALELSGEEWRKHQGELRVIVARPFQQKGLGMILVREMYFLAVEKKVEQVIVKMMRPQIAAQRIFRKLGFREELLIPDYVQDRGGKKQDLIIMVCDTKDLWNELEHFYGDSDWQRCR